MDAALQELWALVEEAARTEPDTTRNSMIVPAANEVIDLSATRAWITWYQMPATVLILLALCMIVSSLLSGHSSGQAGRRHFGLWASQNVLVALVLFVVLDFDRPRHGFIQTNHRPLLDLRRTMTPAAP